MGGDERARRGRSAVVPVHPALRARRDASSPDLVKETLRQFLLTLWNTYSFFVTYANIDGFDADAHAAYWKGSVWRAEPVQRSAERARPWIVSELNGLVNHVRDDLDDLNPTSAGRRIQEFTGSLSNWYVRRSRRRFWKSENDDDKGMGLRDALLLPADAQQAHRAADAVRGRRAVPQPGPRRRSGQRASGRLPAADESLIDDRLDRAVRLAMRIASLGRSARGKSGVKVRQPLGRALVRPRVEDEELLALIMPQGARRTERQGGGTRRRLRDRRDRDQAEPAGAGPELGAQLSAARKAIAAADAASVVVTLALRAAWRSTA